MDISAADTVVEQVFRQFFCHAFGQGGDKHALFLFDALLNLFHQVVYLVQAGTHLNYRVQQSRRTNHLFHYDTFTLLQFVFCRSSTHVNYLLGHLLELFECKRTVVHGGRQTESVFHQVCLAGTVAAVHGPDLRHADMAFVDDNQKIFGKEIKQAVGTGARFASVEVT